MTLTLLALVTALHVHAAEPAMTKPYDNIAAGPSVPASDANFGIDAIPKELTFTNALSRKSGGEILSVGSQDAKKNPISLDLTGVRLIAYSKSGKGSILVRNAQANLNLDGAHFQKISVNPLMIYAQRSSPSHASEKDGHVLLQNGDFVRYDCEPGQTLRDICVQMEAFGDNDTSFVFQAQYKPANVKGAMIHVARQLATPISSPPARGGGGSSSNDGTCAAACAGSRLNQYMQCANQPGADAMDCQREAYSGDCGC